MFAVTKVGGPLALATFTRAAEKCIREWVSREREKERFGVAVRRCGSIAHNTYTFRLAYLTECDFAPYILLHRKLGYTSRLQPYKVPMLYVPESRNQVVKQSHPGIQPFGPHIHIISSQVYRISSLLFWLFLRCEIIRNAISVRYLCTGLRMGVP